MSRRQGLSSGYQVFMLALCLYALGVLAAQSLVRLSPDTRTILEYADYAICTIFFVDFLVSLKIAPNRWHYLRTWGWLDLLSSIPMVDSARWGRFARVLRVFRVLRGLRAAKLIADVVMRDRAQNTFLAASFVAILLIVFCSVAVLHFEDDSQSNIRTAEDAIWWSLTTITTVGYGDHFPVTTEGRFVATLLMAAGVGLFGIFSGCLAAWFLGSRSEDSDTQNVKELSREVVQLRRQIEQLVSRYEDVASVESTSLDVSATAAGNGREI